MILEAAILDVKKGMEADFETSYAQAKAIISSQPGFISLQLQKCLETENRYLLLVNLIVPTLCVGIQFVAIQRHNSHCRSSALCIPTLERGNNRT